MTIFSREEVAEIVEQEGLGYAILSYIDGNEIKDGDLSTLWKRAEAVLREIEEILYLID